MRGIQLEAIIQIPRVGDRDREKYKPERKFKK
jgi:hypothetical protein